MARPKKAPQRIEPEDESQEEIEALEATEPDDKEPEDGDTRQKVTKADAIRAALAAGKEGREEGPAYIRDRFGIEISKTHFSATKSNLKKREGLGVPSSGATKGRSSRKPRSEAEVQSAPQRKAESAGGDDLIESLEALKPLVQQLGPEKVKRLVDLLG